MTCLVILRKELCKTASNKLDKIDVGSCMCIRCINTLCLHESVLLCTRYTIMYLCGEFVSFYLHIETLYYLTPYRANILGILLSAHSLSQEDICP